MSLNLFLFLFFQIFIILPVVVFGGAGVADDGHLSSSVQASDDSVRNVPPSL
jgi:hypothetical protein